MDFGDTPDIIDPSNRRKLMRGEHPLGQHPAMSLSHQTRLASNTYKQTMAQLQRYTGRMPRSRQDAGQAAMDLFRTLEDVMRRERAHKAELEQLAVKTVLEIPQFKSLRAPVQRGEIKMDAKLGPARLERAVSSAEQEEEPQEMEVPEVRQEIDDAVMKRRFINALNQGAAVSNNYAYAYYAADDLSRIDPAISQDYGKLMALSEIGYWVQDPAVMQAAAKMHGTSAQGGSSEIGQDNDGTPVIRARGLVFPMLVQELVKGLMEYLSFNDEEAPEVRKIVHDKADLIDEEGWAMMLGPALWKQFLDAIGGDAQDIVPHLYDEINRMPISQFNALAKGIVEGTPQAKQQLQQMAAKVRRELPPEEQSEAQEIARKILEDCRWEAEDGGSEED